MVPEYSNGATTFSRVANWHYPEWQTANGNSAEEHSVSIVYQSHTAEWHSRVSKWHKRVSKWHKRVSKWHSIVSKWHNRVAKWHKRVAEWHSRVAKWHYAEWHTLSGRF